MELGGNIELEGFSDLDPGELVVVKKIVGNVVRELSNKHEAFSGLRLIRGAERLTGELQVGSEILSAVSEDENLYFALDEVSKELAEKARQ